MPSRQPLMTIIRISSRKTSLNLFFMNLDFSPLSAREDIYQKSKVISQKLYPFFDFRSKNLFYGRHYQYGILEISDLIIRFVLGSGRSTRTPNHLLYGLFPRASLSRHFIFLPMQPLCEFELDHKGHQAMRAKSDLIQIHTTSVSYLLRVSVSPW